MTVATNPRRKPGLTSLIGQQWNGDDTDGQAMDGQQETPAAPVEAPAVEQPPEPPKPEPVKTAPARKRAPAKPKVPPAPPGEPLYLRMTRREARMTEAQADALDAHTRRLNRARRGRGERLTWNSLNRVALDLLLSRAGELAGTTEDELRASVGLGVTDSQSS